MPTLLARPVEQQYTFAEVCELLRYSKRTLQRRIASRSFKPAPWNDHGTTKFSASSVNDYIERKRLRG